MRVSTPAALFLALILTASDGHAAVCWSLTPFTDTIKVVVRGSEGSFTLAGSWETPDYQLPFIGSAGPDTLGDGFRVGLQGINESEFFAGFSHCVLDATVDEAFEGPFEITCGSGGFGPIPGTLVVVPCDAERGGGIGIGEL